MKHYYPQFKFKLLRDASPGHQPSNYEPLKFYNQMRSIQNGPPMEKGDIDNVFIMANAEYHVFNNEAGNHIFVDPDTEQVILNATRKLTMKDLARYRPDIDIGILYRTGKNPILYNFASENPKSAAILIECYGIFRVDDIAEVAPEDERNEVLRELKESLRFLCGCFMMIEMFPEVLHNGLPDYVKHPVWFKHGINFSVGITHKATAKCPHIRSGHFRLLSSERYVNKRGQIVFVKPSLINGKAKHTEPLA